MTRDSERRWIWALVAFAFLRVLASGALFPFFNNVDEPSHADLVFKYARGAVPDGLEPYSPELARFSARYSSPEFLFRSEEYGEKGPQPPTGAGADQRVAVAMVWAQGNLNKESGEPPLYYVLAALWLRLGQALGTFGVTELYWVRALDALFAALLVWLGHVTARVAFPESLVQRLGVPLLLATIPQDTFYAIAPDMLSPVCFGLGYLGILRFGTPGARARVSAARTGLALAGAVLVKVANSPLIGVACLDAVLRARSLARQRGARAVFPSLALLLACAIIPFAAWLTWNEVRLGDWTATADKIRELTWTRKPLSAWWLHPLFSISGLHEFWSELMASFWRGEFVWQGARLTNPWMDRFYWGSSAIFPLVALLRLPANRESRHALVLAAACFASGVLFLAALSLAYDFGACHYPSPAHPFFTSGRLVSGALVPFLLLYVHGIDRALVFSASERVRFAVLGVIAAAMTVSEVWFDLSPAASAFNFFHVGG